MDYILNIIKKISEYGAIWIIALIIYNLIKIYKYKEEEPEENLILKMIGFYLLGCFSFNLNGFLAFPIVLPLGFLIYYFGMMDKERRNKTIKHKCATLGVVILGVSFINGFLYNALEYRSYKIKTYQAEVGKLEENWSNIEKKLKLSGDSMLSEFRMNYDKNKKVNNIYFEFTNPVESDKLYMVSSSFEGKLSVDILKNETDDMFNYNMYNNDYYQIEVDEFMKIISNLEFAKSSLENSKVIASYDVIYQAHNSTTSLTNVYEDDSIYIIDSVKNNYKDIEYREAKYRELPIKGIVINHFPMERVKEDMTSSTNTDTYVLDAFTNEYLIKENTESLTIENIKEDKSTTYSDYDYRINEIAEVLEFYNWKEIKEEVNSDPYIILKDDNNTIVTLYEDNYASYEDKEEKIVYKIPELTVKNLLETINIK